MDYLITFLVGGGICVIGQILMDTTKLTAPRILVIFVVAGVALQALLPGFGYALAKGAMEGAKEGFLGAITGAVKATAAGIAAAVSFGYIVAVLFSPKSPK